MVIIQTYQPDKNGLHAYIIEKYYTTQCIIHKKRMPERGNYKIILPLFVLPVCILYVINYFSTIFKVSRRFYGLCLWAALGPIVFTKNLMPQGPRESDQK